MEIIDKAVVTSITDLMRDLKKCELSQQTVVTCGWLDRIVKCGFPFWCGRRLFQQIERSLIDHCGAEFYQVCGAFGDVIGPICPFDPVPFERFEQLNVRINALEAKVERLLQR